MKKPPLPFYYYYIPFFLIAIIGLADSIYLTISHIRLHVDISYSSFCAISRALNCDTVSSSSYALFLGVPIALWGVVGYTFLVFLICFAGRQPYPKNRLWSLIFYVSLLFSAGSIVLAWISTSLIHSYCIMCILSYLVNFFLLFYAWFVNTRFGDTAIFKGLTPDLKFLLRKRMVTGPFLGAFFLIVLTLIIGLPEYWKIGPPEQARAISKGYTEEGHPWTGAENPELVIHEYTDYLCAQCRIKHYYLRRFVAANPNKIRLVHHNFPMDEEVNPIVNSPYHVGSGALALFSIYAGSHSRFWEVNDLLFKMNLPEKGSIGIREIAEKLGFSVKNMKNALTNRYVFNQLQEDIKEGIKLGLTGTPGYVIDGKIYQGHIPPGILKIEKN